MKATERLPAAPRRLPAKDFVFIPLISLLTVLVMLGGVEIGSRIALPEHAHDACLVDDPLLGHRAKPSCVSKSKVAEGEWVENRYNECGYRSDTSCGPLPPGALRLAVVGSSLSWGYHSPTQETWYYQTAKALAAKCGRPVDVQNLSGIFSLSQVATRIPQAIALKPDAALIVLAPKDLLNTPNDSFQPGKVAPEKVSHGIQKLRDEMLNARSLTVAQHFIFRQQKLYISMYLKYGDKADFLRPPFTPAWQHRFAYTDQALGYMADAFHKAGIPMILITEPQEAQAYIVANGESYPGIDTLAFGRAMGEIARRHGILFGDVTPRFAGLTDAPDYFLNVDAHPNRRGNQLEAETMLPLLEGIPPFDACTGRM